MDEHNEPLPFVSVYIRNSGNGTAANASGAFKLNVKPGKYELVFQYIGYKQKIQAVQVGEKPVQLTVRMEPDELILAQVEITTEDPAYRIMREAIAKRSYYKNKLTDYNFEAYVKGFHKFVDAPKKIMGKEIGNMGGILDTNRTGVIYLSESVSKVSVRNRVKKEVMISSKVSGSENGFSLNRATYTDFSFYDERTNIDRDILSPLADNAFAYYDFKLRGKYVDQNNNSIYKIQVIPRRPADPAWAGHIYIVDEWWNIGGADLYLLGTSIKQPVLDTLRIHQEFFQLAKPDTWGLLSQVTTFRFGILGFKIQGLFNGVFSNYEIQPRQDVGLSRNESFKIEDKANERDTAYWTTIRPVPLTAEESRDYTRKDSLQRIWNSKAYKDSIDRKDNKFGFSNLFFGYTWQNSWKHLSIGYPSVFDWIQFNTVQGLVLDVRPSFTKREDSRGTRRWKAEAFINYGFSEQKLRGGGSVERKFESIHYTTIGVGGGVSTQQFNSREPVTVFGNTAASLFRKLNYLKLYEKTYGSIKAERHLRPGLLGMTEIEYAERRPLQNTSDFTFYKKNKTREYTSNDPVPSDQQPFFTPHQAFVIRLQAEFRIGEKYATYPHYREYESSEWPIFKLRYTKAVPGIGQAVIDYDLLEWSMEKQGISWGLAGYSDFNVLAGAFLRKKRLEFMDLHHPLGNRLTALGIKDPVHSFLWLPYYDYATDQPFVEAHWQHHLQGWLLDKIPLVRKLNWKETFGAKVYYTKQYWSDAVPNPATPYWELNFGFENIGFQAFRMFRVQVASSFFGKQYGGSGILLGIGL